MIESLKSLDQTLFFFLNGGVAATDRAFWLDQAMLLVSSRITWLVIAASVVLYAAVRRRRQLLEICLLVGISIGLTDLVTYQVLKQGFARERPCHQLEGVRLVQERCGGDYGFPSNHAANSMAAAVMISLISRHRVSVALVLAAFLVGFSRIYIGVHFPGDVTVGFAVGALMALAIYIAYVPIRGRLFEMAKRPGCS